MILFEWMHYVKVMLNKLKDANDMSMSGEISNDLSIERTEDFTDEITIKINTEKLKEIKDNEYLLYVLVSIMNNVPTIVNHVKSDDRYVDNDDFMVDFNDIPKIFNTMSNPLLIQDNIPNNIQKLIEDKESDENAIISWLNTEDSDWLDEFDESIDEFDDSTDEDKESDEKDIINWLNTEDPDWLDEFDDSIDED